MTVRFLKAHDQLIDTRDGSQTYRVLSAIPVDGLISVLNHKARKDEWISWVEIRQKITAGLLRVQREGDAACQAVDQNDPEYLAALNTAHAQLQEVMHMQHKMKTSFSSACDVILSMKCSFPSKATLYRYREAYINQEPLLRSNANKGRRQPRYSQEVDAQICDIAKTNYLVPYSRWRLNKLQASVNNDLRQRNLLSTKHQVSCRYIRKVIQEQLTIDPAATRMDPKNRSAARSIATKRMNDFAFFERVEQDTVHLPFVIQTPSGISSDIHLTHAIECSCSMPIGWKLTVGKPEEADTLACIKSMLFSKKQTFAQRDIDFPIDPYGSPNIVVLDNGPENRGRRLERLPLLGISVEHLRARTPQKKPFIERFNRSLKEALETLPGSTRFNGVDGKRDPLALNEQLLSLEELEQFIVRWYYEKWCNTALEKFLHMSSRKLGYTPKERWLNQLQSGCFMQIPVTDDEWTKITYLREKRKISRKTGITYDGLNYKGKALADLIRQHGESSVEILVNLDDYRFIYVLLPDEQKLLCLEHEFLTPDSPAYSFSQYKAIAQEKRQNYEAPVAVRKFDQDIDVKSRSTNSARKPTQRNQKTAQATKHSQALTKATQKPLVPLHTAPSNPLGNTTSSMPAGFSFDDLPSLELIDRNTGETRS